MFDNNNTKTHRYTVCFLFTQDGRDVLLQTKNRTSFAGKLNGVGGKLEPGETPAECASREIHEETGILVRPDDLVPVNVVTLPTDCASDENDATACELNMFAAVVDPERVNPPEDAEPVGFYAVEEVLSLPVTHGAFAGDGDVLYLVNESLRTLARAGRLSPDGAITDENIPRLESATTAHRGRHLTLRTAEYALPDGTKKSYEYVTRRPDDRIESNSGPRRPDGVAILLFDADGTHVLLEHEFRMAVGRRVWNLPMGLVDPGEHDVDAVLRELYEETGLKSVNLSRTYPALPVAYSAPGLSDQTERLFVGFATVRAPHPVPRPARPRPEETMTSRWMSRRDVARLLDDGEAAVASRAQALLLGWTLGADYVGLER